MPKISPTLAKLGAAGALVALLRRWRDPVRAPGHRHRRRPPDEATPPTVDVRGKRDQPWIRRSHSDSQQRRFRR